ncbi:IQ domain-containing protein/DUF4005 domain-containing protein [Cephalotus follicularis]|uniref:IQ domain-containing protein/DUF4005 domain-containing protein n=1 Tax=Cephalotus follicularis TaxID=3775 RepID=A0A1Q3BLX0_CEPFO|nr:IQ domain-containing protein/DUF4005 domain-containing protein [Cephalotus follicularis]
MGKASKWFRSMLGLKKPDPQKPTPTPHATTNKEKNRRWSFVKSYREKEGHNTILATKQTRSTYASSNTMNHQEQEQQQQQQQTAELAVADDPSKHAIAVAAATAAVAEAAVAAAEAAAAVVRLTSSGRCAKSPTAYVSSRYYGPREEFAALKIQSAFRGYLAKRALRALRGLVRLQALVRGHIERKRTAQWLQRMQALLRAQARARAGRAQISESSQSSSKSSHFNHGPPTPEKCEHVIRSKSSKYEQSYMLKRNWSKSNGRVINDQDKGHLGWNSSDCQMDERSWDQRVPSTRINPTDDEKSDKILEIDTGKPYFAPKRRNIFHSSHLTLVSDQYSGSFTTSKDSTTHQTNPSPSSGEVQSLTPLKFSQEVEESPFYTADNSPQFSASSKGGKCKSSPFTPTRSDGSKSFLSGYSDHPNYMAYTESSRAKARSLSAPKQRPQYERSSSAKRNSVHGFGELRSNAQSVAALHVNFASKAYPGSGRLDRLGMPVGQRY